MTLLEPPDGFGFPMVIPDARPNQAWTAVMDLGTAGRELQWAAQTLTGSASAAGVWSGGAAEAYRGLRAQLSRRLVESAEVAVESAALIKSWLTEAEAAIAAMRVARSAVEVAQAEVDAARAQARYWTPELTGALDDAWARWGRAKRAYWDGLDHVSAKLLALRDRIDGRPLDADDQVRGFYRCVRDGLFAEPARFAWGLTGEALVDRDAWRENVASLPGQAWGSFTWTVEHPGEAAGAAVDADGWLDGRYGEAIATGTMLFVPGPHWLREVPDSGALRFARNILDPRAPRPSLQTVDEMFGGVDLARHEHAAYGHTISRHVDVDDDYLMDRLTNGTLVEGGARSFTPREASRFTDLPTAERAVTETLRANEELVRRYVSSGDRETCTLRMPTSSPLGRVLRRAGAGFEARDGTRVVVQLKNGPHGPYLLSAYLE